MEKNELNKGEDIDMGDDEGQVPKILACPGQPSKEERRRHNCTHIPYRAWCDHCVRGRGRNRAARNICGSYNAAKGIVPRVHADYAFFSVNAAGEECEDDEPGSRIVLKILVIKETMCGSVWAYAVQHKGYTMEPWIRNQIIYDLNTIGMKDERISIKNDQEPSLVDLVKEVARVRDGAGTALDESRVGDSNSNARAEVAVQETKGMVRTLRSALEKNIGQKIPIDHPILPWLVRHSGLNITRFQVRDDGITSMHKMKGYKGIMPICEFGEVIHFRPHDALKQGGYNDRWEDGVWLGFDARSGENVVGTPKGVYRTGAMRRKPPDSQWSKEMLDNIVGTPETPVPGGADGRPPSYAQSDAPKKKDVVQPIYAPSQEPPLKVRGLYVQRKDVKEHGPTPQCIGCRALTTPGMGTRTHTNDCRQRFELLLAQSESGKARVDKVNEKMTEAIVDISEQETKKRKMHEGEIEDTGEPKEDPKPSSEARGSKDPAPGASMEVTADDHASEGQSSRKRKSEEPGDESRTVEPEDRVDDSGTDAEGGTGEDVGMASSTAEPSDNTQADMGIDEMSKGTKGLREGGSHALMKAAKTSDKEEHAQRHGSEPKPTKWGRQASGAVREPGQVDQNVKLDKAELEWKYVGSGIVARTFPMSSWLVLTTKSGPAVSEIAWRSVRCVRSGKLLHECRPEDTPDKEIEKELENPLDIRVELTLKKGPEMFRKVNSDIAEVFSPPRIVQEAGLRNYGGRALQPGWSLDLTMKDPESGKVWDFSKEEMRSRARKLVRESKPFLVIGSPHVQHIVRYRTLIRKDGRRKS